MHLSPAREPLEDSGIETYSVDNVAPITPFNGWLPASVISNDGVQVYRDRNILYVGLSLLIPELKYCLRKLTIPLLKS